MVNVPAHIAAARLLVLAAAALLASACAGNPKAAKSSTEIIDGAASRESAATTPAPARDAAAESAPAAEACSLVRVRFAFDSAQLDDGAMRALRDDADCLSRRRTTALLVEGHCDERGTTEYNVALGARRADAVKRYLAALGVGARIETVSFGKELPLASGSGEAAWAQNRRSELRVAGEKRSDGQLVASY
jgi:peptidoglycan-associated lipoprotein